MLAFLIAPLWVPAAAVPFAGHMSHTGSNRIGYITVIIVAIFAYGGVAALGLPAFRLLRTRKHIAFWIAAVLRFAVGVVTCLIFIVLFGLSLGNSWSFVSHDLVSNSAHLWAVLPTGLLGAAVGATLWLIAKPDRGWA